MADLSKKKIWLQVKRRYLGEDNENVPEDLYCVSVSDGQAGNNIKEEICNICNLNNVENKVLKLRNHRGSIIPITAKVPANTNTSPYILEVVKEHQFIKPQPRYVKGSHSETMKEKFAYILSRVEKLETAAPNLRDRQDAKINKEMEELRQTLEFLNKRFQDAEAVHWKGMFKKNPLW